MGWFENRMEASENVKKLIFKKKITCWACQYAFKNVKIGMFYVLSWFYNTRSARGTWRLLNQVNITIPICSVHFKTSTNRAGVAEPCLKITERNTDPSLFTHCIEPKIAIVSINQNALAEYWSLSAFTILPKLLCVYHRSDDLHPLLPSTICNVNHEEDNI